MAKCATCGDELILGKSDPAFDLPGRRSYRVMSATGACGCGVRNYLLCTPENAVRYVVALLASRDAARFDPTKLDLQAIDDLLYRARPKPTMVYSKIASMGTPDKISYLKARRREWHDLVLNDEEEIRNVARRLEEGLPAADREPARPYTARWRVIATGGPATSTP